MINSVSFSILKTSHHSAQTEWNEIKKDEELVRKKITDYLDIWNKAGAITPTPPPPTTTTTKTVETKKSAQTNGKKR